MKRSIVLILIIILVATLLGGCSGNSGNSKPVDAPESTSAAPTNTTASAAPETTEQTNQQSNEQNTERSTEHPKNTETSKQSPNTQKNTYSLSQLKNGDPAGTLTINNIAVSDSEAKFDLNGSLTLIGEIYYDDFTSSLWFEVTDKANLPLILVDSINKELEYRPSAIYFKNYNSFYNSLPAGTVKEIKENFKRVSATVKVKNLSAWVKADYSETGSEFVSLNLSSNSSASSSNTTPPIKNNPQPQSQLLRSYETMKEYKFDLDGNQKVDTFSLETDNKSYINLFINEWGYSVALERFTPEHLELLYGKYRIVKIDGTNKYVFALYVASPPNDYEVYFLEYEDKGYDKFSSGQKEAEELKVLDVATVDLGMFNYDFDAFFNSDVHLSQMEVNIGGRAFSFQR